MGTDRRFASFQGKENLVLPLVILGCVSVIGGLSGLRLPETLHHRLPQTVEEGELFGKDWTCADCFRCVPIKYVHSAATQPKFDQAPRRPSKLLAPFALFVPEVATVFSRSGTD